MNTRYQHQDSSLTLTGTVVIDYDAKRALFISQIEQIEFTAEKLLEMLHRRAEHVRIEITASGSLTIRVGACRCNITTSAVHQLSRVYQRDKNLLSTFPLCQMLFNMNE